MDGREVSANSLSFIGDAVYTLHVREYFISHGFQSSKKLQYLCNRANCAQGQMWIFDRLNVENFFRKEELDAFRRGRNHISHIPRNGDLVSYEVATGLEALVGYLYLFDKVRLAELFSKIEGEDLWLNISMEETR